MIYDFPISFMFHRQFPGALGRRMASAAPLCLQPPFPWATWRQLNVLTDMLPGQEGHIAEFGVAKGGMSILLGQIAQEHDRRVYACDSFAGLPEPDPTRDNPYFEAGFYAPTAGSQPLLERFTRELSDRGLSQTVIPLQAFFEDLTDDDLPQTLALAHLDSDLYGSVAASLRLAWPRLHESGVLVVDDFFHPAQGPARACRDFFNEVGEPVVYEVLFPYSVMVRKGQHPGRDDHRAHDGNFYRLTQLKQDSHFLDCLTREVERSGQGSSARVLLESLEEDERDIYGYWYALREYWSAIDVPLAEVSQPLTL